MKIVVLMKQVPDLADELEVGADGKALDTEFMGWVTNEFDDHALEEALHVKESEGGSVTVLALGSEEIEGALFTALAKGADRALMVGEEGEEATSHAAAAAYAEALRGMEYDLVLTGVQAIDDLDGQVGPLVAQRLGIPHVSVVTHLSISSDGALATVNQEYAGGVLAEFEVELPAVLGIQAARSMPRYAPISRVRQLMKTSSVGRVPADLSGAAGVEVLSLFRPEGGGEAEMIEGDEDVVAERLAALIEERGLL